MGSDKYLRTPHLPFSPGGTNDDRRLKSVDHLLGKEIVITEKMDGSNLCFTSGGVFARSHSGPPRHPSFDAAKAAWAMLRPKIQDNESNFGEWCLACHSIIYSALPGFFLFFGVRLDVTQEWLSWDEVIARGQDLDVPTTPVLWRGSVKHEKELHKLVDTLAAQPSACGGVREGVVLRVVGRIATQEWEASIAKWVRANHVQTDDHWTNMRIVRNKLRR